LRSPSKSKIDRLEIFIDGRLQEERKPIAAGEGEIKVKVPTRDVEVSLIAWSGELASEPAPLRLTWVGAAAGEDLLKPKLYALVVGVSKYADKSYELRYASKDAADFAHMMEEQRGGMY